MISNKGQEEDQNQFLKQQFKLSDEELRMAADADFMQNVIGQRKEDINNIANIMSDINAIAKDLAIETNTQGDKLKRLDQNIADADNNAEEALG
jgi:hypothetical protein